MFPLSESLSLFLLLYICAFSDRAILCLFPPLPLFFSPCLFPALAMPANFPLSLSFLALPSSLCVCFLIQHSFDTSHFHFPVAQSVQVLTLDLHIEWVPCSLHICKAYIAHSTCTNGWRDMFLFGKDISSGKVLMCNTVCMIECNKFIWQNVLIIQLIGVRYWSAVWVLHSISW